MGIWIRSQDKKSLLLCKSFDVDCDSDNYIILVNYEIRNKKQYYSPIGYYSSVEKAAKVLDMIQKHIETHGNNVFQMPQDIIIIDDDEEAEV
ncbi:MAG: hypothetical protein ACLUCZ_07340 [Thomasclavelia ramosa]